MWGEGGRRFEDLDDDKTPVPHSDREPGPREELWREYQEVATDIERVSRRMRELERGERTEGDDAELAALRERREALSARRGELESELADKG